MTIQERFGFSASRTWDAPHKTLGRCLLNAFLACACFGIGAQSVLGQTSPRMLTLTLAQPAVFYGQSVAGTVTLSQQAPSGGTCVGFVQPDPGVTFEPMQQRIAEGQTTAAFRVITAPGSAIENRIDSRFIDAVLSDTCTFRDNTGVRGRVSLQIEPIRYTITLPARAVGGSTVTGTLSMGTMPIFGTQMIGNRPAPASIPVTFFVDPQDVVARDYLIVPQAIVLPAGQTSVPFQLTTKPLRIANGDLRASLRSTGGGTEASASLTLESHKITSLAFSPTTVVGNAETNAAVTISAPAPPGGLLIDIGQQSPVSPRLFVGYQSLVIAPGQLTGSVALRPSRPDLVTQEVDIQMTAVWSNLTATVKFLPPPPPPPTLASLTLANPVLFWGQGTTGTVTLSGPAPAEGMVVEFVRGVLGNGLTATPDTITLAPGQTTATFQIGSDVGTPPRISATRSIAAETRGSTAFRSAVLKMERTLVSLSLNVARSAGVAPISGTASMGFVAINGAERERIGGRPAPIDIVVALSSSAPNVMTVPATVTIPAGQTSANFTVSPSEVQSLTNVQIRGPSSGEVVHGAAVNLEPLAITGVTINPARIAGGMQATGKVTLNGIAGQSGASVRVTSSAAHTTVPATVTVPAGQSEANFNIATTAVTQETSVNVFASRSGGSSAHAALTLVTEQQSRMLADKPLAQAMTPQITGNLAVAMAAPAPGDLVLQAITASRPRARLIESGPLGRIEVGSNFADAKRVAIRLSLGANERCDAGGDVYNTLRDVEIRPNTRTNFDVPGPASLPPATIKQMLSASALWVCALVDSESRIVETNRSNNCRCARIP